MRQLSFLKKPSPAATRWLIVLLVLVIVAVVWWLVSREQEPVIEFSPVSTEPGRILSGEEE